MLKPPASTVWTNESSINGDEEVLYQPRFADKQSGAEPIQMTSLPAVSTHIYPEAPISSPDGMRFVWRRMQPATGQGHYFIADLHTLKVRQITDEADAGPPIFTPDGKWLYYSVGRVVWRMDPQSFEREEWYAIPESLGKVGAIISIAGCGTRVVASANPAPARHGAISIDLAAKTARLCFEQRDARNPHVQYSRNTDYKVCVQVNDGIEFDAHGNLVRLIGDNGASLWVANDDGSNPVKLAVGSSPVERVQGHQCWLGHETRVITTTHRRTRVGEPWNQHAIVTVAPGDKEARVVGDGSAQNINFCHMHTTPDGRYWISDCNRTAKIYIGSVKTGRFKRIIDSESSFGAAQYTHPHPCFLGDGRWIGWNSDVTGVPQVYVAKVPEGFLGDLG